LADFIEDEEVASLFRRVTESWILYPHRITDKKERKKVVRTFRNARTLEDLLEIQQHLDRQTNGQMMGDRRSFPILCFLHVAMKKLFIERHVKPLIDRDQFWLLNKIPIAVNGDDGLISIPSNLVEKYFEFMDEFWEINRLKTYVSTEFCSFNSQFFFRDGKGIPLFRWNLAMRRNKFGAKGLDPRVWNSIVQSLPKKYHSAIWQEFYFNWKDILCDCSKRGGNWFLPLCYGGAGLEPGGLETSITNRQKFAIHLVNSMIGSSDAPQFMTRVKKCGVNFRGYLTSREKIYSGRSRKFQRKEGVLAQEKRLGTFKEVFSDSRLKFHRLPKRYLGRQPPIFRDLGLYF
jgi:hypothetical protein